MLTLDRHLIRQVSIPMVGGLGVLLLLFTAYNAANLLRDAVSGQVASEHVLLILTIRDLIALEVLLPTAFYLSAVLAVATLHRDREAFAAYAAGISPNRCVRGLWVLSAIIAILVAGLSNYARPWAYETRYELAKQASELLVENMQPGRYYTWQDDLVITAARVRAEDGELQEVFAQNRAAGTINVVRAKRGRIQPERTASGHWFLFEDGTSYQIDLAGRQDRTSRFGRFYYRAPPAAQTSPAEKRRARSTRLLSKSEKVKEIAEFQWRMTVPLVAFLIGLVGIQLGRTQPGRTPYTRLTIAVVVYAVVFNAAQVVRIAIENQQIPIYPGMYSVPAAVAIGLVLMSRIPRLSLSRPA
ncbi:MAG: LPS export ABC transporter permease LptF [Gammaproteobacteria bacterium]|nr:LPS export ABC transporter permease LptF [Gammaproteobacteria bacterium]